MKVSLLCLLLIARSEGNNCSHSEIAKQLCYNDYDMAGKNYDEVIASKTPLNDFGQALAVAAKAIKNDDLPCEDKTNRLNCGLDNLFKCTKSSGTKIESKTRKYLLIRLIEVMQVIGEADVAKIQAIQNIFLQLLTTALEMVNGKEVAVAGRKVEREVIAYALIELAGLLQGKGCSSIEPKEIPSLDFSKFSTDCSELAGAIAKTVTVTMDNCKPAEAINNHTLAQEPSHQALTNLALSHLTSYLGSIMNEKEQGNVRQLKDNALRCEKPKHWTKRLTTAAKKITG